MSVEPPNECDSAIFNATCWIGDPTLTGNYVEFPVAQGNNTLLDVTANNILVTDSVVIQGALLVTDLATLSAGVLTDTINTITAGSALSIGTDSTHTGNTLIGGSNVNSKIFIDTSNTGNTNSDPAISIGTSAVVKTIKIGSSAITNSIHLASLDVTGNSLNHIVPTSGVINIATSQTTGQLNIGTNSIRSGEINIGSVSSQAFNINIGNATNGAITIGGLNAEFQLLSQGFSLSSSSGLTSDVLFPMALNAGLSLGGAGTVGQVFTSQATASPIWSTIVAPSSNGTAGQLLTSNATSTPVFSTIVYPTTNGTVGQLLISNATSTPFWGDAPVAIKYYADTIIPPALDLSGSVSFPLGFFTNAPKITLTGFVSAGTTIVVVGVSSKTSMGFTWLASSTGLSGIDYIAVET